jgi:hypothetical protein
MCTGMSNKLSPPFRAGSKRAIGQQTYITKGETLEVKGLTPKTIYEAQVATVNASGSAVRGLLFETK